MHPWVYFRIGPEAQDVNEAEDQKRRSGKGSRECYLEAEQLEVNGVGDQSGLLNDYLILGPRTISTTPAISNVAAATGGTVVLCALSTVAVIGPNFATSSRLW
jgi:hypothetical protein